MTLRVLHFEDNADDARLIHRYLKAHGVAAEMTLVAKPDDYLTALAGRAFELIISDVSLPGYTGLEAMQAARDAGLDVPIIILSGGEHAALASEMYRNAGAYDYISKQELSKLVGAIQRVADAHA